MSQFFLPDTVGQARTNASWHLMIMLHPRGARVKHSEHRADGPL